MIGYVLGNVAFSPDVNQMPTSIRLCQCPCHLVTGNGIYPFTCYCSCNKNTVKNSTEIYQVQSSGLTPHKCPVCNGIGEKENLHLPEQIANPDRFIKCKSCDGKGIVWG